MGSVRAEPVEAGALRMSFATVRMKGPFVKLRANGGLAIEVGPPPRPAQSERRGFIAHREPESLDPAQLPRNLRPHYSFRRMPAPPGIPLPAPLAHPHRWMHAADLTRQSDITREGAKNGHRHPSPSTRRRAHSSGRSHCAREGLAARDVGARRQHLVLPVSYTHLTLPTIYSV